MWEWLLTHPQLGTWIGYVLGFIALLALAYAALRLARPASVNLLFMVAGVLLGWTAGMLLTPLAGETAKFQEYGRAISTFLGGYGLAKVDRLFDLFTKDRSDNDLVVGRVLIFVSSFALGVLFTFVWRSYVTLAAVS